MAFPVEFMQKLRDMNDIVEMFRRYTTVKKSGRLYMCCCPFHTEKTPSCAIYPDDQHFYCFGCGATGDVISFVEKMDNISFYEAVQVLAQQSNLQIPSRNPQEERTADLRRRCLEINRETAKIYFINLLKGSDPRGLQYFQSRGLRMETIRKYGLGFAPDDWHQLRDHLRNKGYTDDEMVIAGVCRRSDRGAVYDYFRNRVIFPIIDLRKNIVAFGGRVLDDSKPKYLNTNDTPVYNKGSNLFSLNFAKEGNPETFILGEGYMDVIAMNQAGFTNAIAVLGTALTDAQVRLIGRYVQQVILSYDSDGAGQRATQRALNMFSSAGIPVRILKMQGAKDPDEFIKKFGAEKFRLLLANSEDALDFRFQQCKEGLDVATDGGKVQYLRRCVNVLAEIDSELQRSVSISRISHEIGVREIVISAQVERARKALGKRAEEEHFHDIQRNIIPRDMLTPQEQQYVKEYLAEENIFAYLLKNPESIRDVMQKITPEYFVTDFHKYAYGAIFQKASQNPDFLPSFDALREIFNEEEMSRFFAVSGRHQEVPVTEQVLQECITLLYNVKNAVRPSQDLTDDDLLKMVANKQKSAT
ncbi:MAG TPA: DNA primase [Ruminococcus sp.]|nr:DNA primase [Ruminococcus sp.]